MATEAVTGEKEAVRDMESERQFVLFQLAGEDYGVDIYSVQRLIQVPEITRVPRSPSFVAGVVDVRGDIIPVINLKKRFGFENTEVDENGRIVIVEIGDQIVGFLVDGVSEVTRLAKDDIEPPSGVVVSKAGAEFIAGIGKQRTQDRNRLIIVLEPEKVLSEDEQVRLDEFTMNQKSGAAEGRDQAVHEQEEKAA